MCLLEECPGFLPEEILGFNYLTFLFFLPQVPLLLPGSTLMPSLNLQNKLNKELGAVPLTWVSRFISYQKTGLQGQHDFNFLLLSCDLIEFDRISEPEELVFFIYLLREGT